MRNRKKPYKRRPAHSVGPAPDMFALDSLQPAPNHHTDRRCPRDRLGYSSGAAIVRSGRMKHPYTREFGVGGPTELRVSGALARAIAPFQLFGCGVDKERHRR